MAFSERLVLLVIPAGRKTRQLQRLELYEFVVKRLNRCDALMPEVISAQTRDRYPI
jgi:hypothetical protein